jgi:hypothetical protein
LGSSGRVTSEGKRRKEEEKVRKESDNEKTRKKGERIRTDDKGDSKDIDTASGNVCANQEANFTFFESLQVKNEEENTIGKKTK